MIPRVLLDLLSKSNNETPRCLGITSLIRAARSSFSGFPGAKGVVMVTKATINTPLAP